MPRSASWSAVALAEARDADGGSELEPRGRARRERRLAAGELEHDLAAVGLVADDDDGLAAARRRPRAASLGGRAGREPVVGSGLEPGARRSRSAVSRARSSGLESTASGCSRRASRSPSARAASRPAAVSGRSSSGSPGAASAWRTRKRRTARQLRRAATSPRTATISTSSWTRCWSITRSTPAAS